MLVKFHLKSKEIWYNSSVHLSYLINSREDFVVGEHVWCEKETEEFVYLCSKGDHALLSIVNYINVSHAAVLRISTERFQVLVDFAHRAEVPIQVEEVNELSGCLDRLLVGDGLEVKEEALHNVIQMGKVSLDPRAEALLIDDVLGVLSVQTPDEAIIHVVEGSVNEGNVVHLLLRD